MKFRIVIFLILLLFGVSLLYPAANPLMAEEAAGQDLLWESFEKGDNWKAVGSSWNDGDSSTKVKTVTDFATEGKKGLCASFKMAKTNAATYFSENVTGKWSNWTKFSHLKVDINNSTSVSLKVVLAVQTGAWVWHESQTVELKPGLTQDVTFSLTDSTFKTQATNWQHTSTIQNANEMKRVILKFFGEAGLTGDVYIDNIRLTPVAE